METATWGHPGTWRGREVPHSPKKKQHTNYMKKKTSSYMIGSKPAISRLTCPRSNAQMMVLFIDRASSIEPASAGVSSLCHQNEDSSSPELSWRVSSTHRISSRNWLSVMAHNKPSPGISTQADCKSARSSRMTLLCCIEANCASLLRDDHCNLVPL